MERKKRQNLSSLKPSTTIYYQVVTDGEILVVHMTVQAIGTMKRTTIYTAPNLCH